jgi:very-short-patch-repair endonuclease
VSRPARALIDTAGRFDRDDLERLVDRTLRKRAISPRDLHIEASRPEFAARQGIAILRRIALERLSEGPPESELEDAMVRLVRRYALPRPVRQYRVTVRGRDVRFDFAYPDVRLAIELNGWGPRYDVDAWQRDHDRRNAAEIGLWRVLEFTWRDVTQRPWFVVSSVAEALGIRPTRWTMPAVADRPPRSSTRDGTSRDGRSATATVRN